MQRNAHGDVTYLEDTWSFDLVSPAWTKVVNNAALKPPHRAYHSSVRHIQS